MKKIIFAMMVMATILSGCGKLPEADVNKRCYDTFSAMESYMAEIKVTAYSNTNKTEYKALQFYKAPGKMRTETPELITVVKDLSMYVKNSASGQLIRAQQLPAADVDFMYLQNVVAAYYQGEQTTAAMQKDKKEEILTLTVETGLSNPYKTEAELKIRTADMMPVSLEIKGKDGKIHTQIEYLSFEINKDIAEEIFDVK